MVIIQELSKDELIGLIDEMLAKALRKVTEQVSDPDDLLSRQEAALHLKVSLSTLHAYTKTGKLIGHRIGGRLLYKRSDLDRALKSTKI